MVKEVIEHLPIEVLPNLGETFSKSYYSCVFNVAKLCAEYDIDIKLSDLMSAFKTVEIEFANNEELIKGNNNISLICAFVFYYCKVKQFMMHSNNGRFPIDCTNSVMFSSILL